MSETGMDDEQLAAWLMQKAHQAVESVMIEYQTQTLGQMPLDQFPVAVSDGIDRWGGDDGKRVVLYPGFWVVYGLTLGRMIVRMNVAPRDVRAMATSMRTLGEDEILVVAADRAADMIEFCGSPEYDLTDLTAMVPWLTDIGDQWPAHVIPWCHALSYIALAGLDNVVDAITDRGIFGLMNAGF